MTRRPVRFFLIVFAVLAGLPAILLYWRFSWSLILSWLIGANLAAAALWSFDKWQSVRRGRRVPETALHVMSALGATPAAFLCMRFLRHKTLKGHFNVLYVAFLVVQVGVAVFVMMLPG